jgi:hypothetical protein
VRVLPIAISLVSLVCLAVPIHAVAKPKPRIAVAPLAGDPGNQVAQAVVDALAGKDFVVVGPKEVGHEMKKLGLSDELDPKDTRKLATKLDVVALVDGKVAKAGNKRSLHLEVHRRGKAESGFTIEFKSTASDSFRHGVHEEIVKKLEGAAEDSADDDGQAGKLAARPAAAEGKRNAADPGIVPGASVRIPVSSGISIFGDLDGMLLLDTGGIQKSTSYGPATVYGLDVVGGVDLALAKQIGLRIALEYSQINFSFNGKGTMASLRDNDSTTQDVMGATDRSIGVTATLGLMY